MNHTNIGHLDERNTQLDSVNVLIHSLQAFSGIMLMLIGYFSYKIWTL